MSRSIKNKYFLSHCCRRSEKKDKKIWHKALAVGEVMTQWQHIFSDLSYRY